MSEGLAIIAIIIPVAINGIVVAYSYGKTRQEIMSIKRDVHELQTIHPRQDKRAK